MSEPLVINGTWNSYPLQLKAGQPVWLTIRSTGVIEAVNLDRRGRFWMRLDTKVAEAQQPNNFVIYLSRRFNTNNAVRKISLVSEQDVWVTVEGASY